MHIGSYEMESPLMNAGGVVKTVEDVEMMAQTGVGAVLAGSYTLEPRVGNSPHGEVVYHHDRETGITTNALGMPNRGLEAVAKDLPTMIQIAHDHGKPFILNFAPVSDNPVAEVTRLSQILDYARVENLDAIELNASCPNVVTADGGRHEVLSHHPEKLAEVLVELNDIAVPFDGLFVRVSPVDNRANLRELVTTLDEAGVDAVTAFNTFPGGKPLDSNGEPILQVSKGIGGQSGRGMQLGAELQTEWLMSERDKLVVKTARCLLFDVIGSNGITTGEAMKRRLDMGVAAVSASTIFFESRRWGDAVNKILNEYTELIEA